MKNGYKVSIVISLVAVEVFIGAFAMTGPPKFYTYAPYQYGDYVQLAVNATNNLGISSSPVSYTHLDVYKRQAQVLPQILYMLISSYDIILSSDS